MHSYILVEALDPFSSLAQDPMGALDELGVVFPPERGAIWFAAGISFTSFALVYGIARRSRSRCTTGSRSTCSVSPRWPCPNPALPMAQVELALQAQISTAEGVFSVQAQLTENSWIINESLPAHRLASRSSCGSRASWPASSC